MKKIYAIFFIGLLAVNLNLFSIKENQNQLSGVPQRKQLSKKDIIKIALASVGCGVFTYSAIMAYPSCRTVKSNNGLADTTEILVNILPAAMAILPLYTIEKLRRLMGINDLDDYRTSFAFAAGGILSAGIAYKCGEYVYKKLSSNKENKVDKA